MFVFEFQFFSHTLKFLDFLIGVSNTKTEYPNAFNILIKLYRLLVISSKFLVRLHNVRNVRNCKNFTLGAIKLLNNIYAQSRFECYYIICNTFYRCHMQSMENIQRKFLKMEGVCLVQELQYRFFIERRNVQYLNIEKKISSMVFFKNQSISQ